MSAGRIAASATSTGRPNAAAIRNTDTIRRRYAGHGGDLAYKDLPVGDSSSPRANADANVEGAEGIGRVMNPENAPGGVQSGAPGVRYKKIMIGGCTMSDELDNLDANEKAALESTLYRRRALAGRIGEIEHTARMTCDTESPKLADQGGTAMRVFERSTDRSGSRERRADHLTGVSFGAKS
jgi:hypothetical protein